MALAYSTSKDLCIAEEIVIFLFLIKYLHGCAELKKAGSNTKEKKAGY
jgi:hypothetical protein